MLRDQCYDSTPVLPASGLPVLSEPINCGLTHPHLKKLEPQISVGQPGKIIALNGAETIRRILATYQSEQIADSFVALPKALTENPFHIGACITNYESGGINASTLASIFLSAGLFLRTLDPQIFS